jgi:MFS family permease
MAERRALQLLLLAVAVAAAGYARTVISPLQEAMRLALSLTDNQIAILQGPAMALPLVIASMPLGLLIDRSIRVRLIFIFAALNLFGSLFTVFAPSFNLLLVARCCVGLAGFTTFPIVMSLLADLYAPPQRGRVTMAISIGQVVGNSAAFALGGALLAQFGSGLDAWRSTMLWLTAPLVLVTLLMLAMREPPRTGVLVAKLSTRETVLELWRYRKAIGPILIGLVMAEIAIGAMLIWTAPTFSRSFNLAADHIGAIMAVVLLTSGLLGPVLGGLLADFCQRTSGPARTSAFLSGLALLSVPVALFPLMPDSTMASVLLIASMTINLAVAVMSMTLLTIVVPNELRGLCMALVVAVNILFAVGVAPVIVSLLSQAIGGPALLGKSLALVGAVAGLLGAAAFALGKCFYETRHSYDGAVRAS